MFSVDQWEKTKRLIESRYVPEYEEDPICNFIINMVKRGHISNKDHNGDIDKGDHLTIPISLVTDLISELLMKDVKQERPVYKHDGNYCPHCGNKFYHIEQSIDEYCMCDTCGKITLK